MRAGRGGHGDCAGPQAQGVSLAACRASCAWRGMPSRPLMSLPRAAAERHVASLSNRVIDRNPRLLALRQAVSPPTTSCRPGRALACRQRNSESGLVQRTGKSRTDSRQPLEVQIDLPDCSRSAREHAAGSRRCFAGGRESPLRITMGGKARKTCRSGTTRLGVRADKTIASRSTVGGARQTPILNGLMSRVTIRPYMMQRAPPSTASARLSSGLQGSCPPRPSSRRR